MMVGGGEWMGGRQRGGGWLNPPTYSGAKWVCHLTLSIEIDCARAWAEGFVRREGYRLRALTDPEKVGKPKLQS